MFQYPHRKSRSISCWLDSLHALPAFLVTLMFVFLVFPLCFGILTDLDTGSSHHPELIEISSNISQGKVSVFHNIGGLIINSGNSDQDSHPSRRGRKPPRMHVTPRNGDVQVTITKTIEFDVELHIGERGPPKQLRGDEESVLESRELTKEEQHMRSLERQLKHDLEI
jgi:hypothetical protein